MTGVRYDWIKDGKADFGLVAQDVETVLPEAVATDLGTGYKSVKYSNLVSPLINATNELYGMCKDTSTKVQDHDRRIASLETQNMALIEENQKLKSRLDAIEAKLGLSH